MIAALLGIFLVIMIGVVFLLVYRSYRKKKEVNNRGGNGGPNDDPDGASAGVKTGARKLYFLKSFSDTTTPIPSPNQTNASTSHQRRNNPTQNQAPIQPPVQTCRHSLREEREEFARRVDAW